MYLSLPPVPRRFFFIVDREWPGAFGCFRFGNFLFFFLAARRRLLGLSSQCYTLIVKSNTQNRYVRREGRREVDLMRSLWLAQRVIPRDALIALFINFLIVAIWWELFIKTTRSIRFLYICHDSITTRLSYFRRNRDAFLYRYQCKT